MFDRTVLAAGPRHFFRDFSEVSASVSSRAPRGMSGTVRRGTVTYCPPQTGFFRGLPDHRFGEIFRLVYIVGWEWYSTEGEDMGLTGWKWEMNIVFSGGMGMVGKHVGKNVAKIVGKYVGRHGRRSEAFITTAFAAIGFCTSYYE